MIGGALRIVPVGLSVSVDALLGHTGRILRLTTPDSYTELNRLKLQCHIHRPGKRFQTILDGKRR